MASYIPGITDYISQVQPWQPDLNFLGNVIQTRQSRYDQSHKQLSKMYGTLLYSPMLRDDNIQARDQFFKMIDQDIKKISGMDLSLQQNTNSASSVFKSLYDNKGIVKDMSFTRQLQNEMGRAENYKNCIDQEQCGGTYWDVGVNALNYRADEFKNASVDEAMSMQAPSYAPFINVTEKAMTYVKDLLGKGFGVTSVQKSADGRYIVTTKNGQNLTVPLYQLFQSQYGQDGNIQNMYETMAYVQRKNYVKTNAEKFGGDEAAAEDDYIRSIEDKVNSLKQQAIETQQKMYGAGSKKQAIAEKIKEKGSTGNDNLANAYVLADIDYNQHVQVADHYDQTAKRATALQTSGDNRKMKASNVDALIARALMDNDFKSSSIIASNLTGDQKIEADPYAKSYYDHSLAMSRMAVEYKYKTQYEIDKARIELMKNKAQAEYENRGPADSQLNTGKYVDAVTGTSADAEKTDEQIELDAYTTKQKTATEQLAGEYVKQTTTYLLNAATNERFTQAQKDTAKAELSKIWGSQYKAESNTFVDVSGEVTSFANLSSQNPVSVYDKAYSFRKDAGNEALYGDFFNQTLDPISQQYGVSRQLVDASTNVYKENNRNVRSYALSSDTLDEDEKYNFGLLVKEDGTLRNMDEFVAMAPNEGFWSGPETAYEDAMENYKKIYNGGNSKGVDPEDAGRKLPLVKAFIDPNAAFGMYAEGKSAGGGVLYNFDAAAPAALGTRGLLTFIGDASLSKGTLYSNGIQNTEEDDVYAKDDEEAGLYQQAVSTLMNDIRTGSYDLKNGKRPFGEVMYMDLALSDPKYKAVHINFAPSYMDQHKGTDKKPTWGGNEEIRKNGITLYVPKEDATNDFTKSFEQKPYDLILNYQPLTIDKPNAGSVTITKDDKTGEFIVGGSLIGYTGEYANGKPVQEIINPAKNYSYNVGGENLYTGLNAWLSELSKANTDFLNNQSVQRYYDPNVLPGINGQILGATGNTENLSSVDIFNQSLGTF